MGVDPPLRIIPQFHNSSSWESMSAPIVAQILAVLVDVPNVFVEVLLAPAEVFSVLMQAPFVGADIGLVGSLLVVPVEVSHVRADILLVILDIAAVVIGIADILAVIAFIILDVRCVVRAGGLRPRPEWQQREHEQSHQPSLENLARVHIRLLLLCGTSLTFVSLNNRMPERFNVGRWILLEGGAIPHFSSLG